jgi:hypothetical protein
MVSVIPGLYLSHLPILDFCIRRNEKKEYLLPSYYPSIRPPDYTRIFFTISPYRSFFFVIFFDVRTSPKSDTQNPRNPTQKSVSTGLALDEAPQVVTISTAEVDTGPDDTTRISVSMRSSDMIIIVTQSPTIVHFQSFLRNTPGSSIPRISPMSGNI